MTIGPYINFQKNNFKALYITNKNIAKKLSSKFGHNKDLYHINKMLS